MKFKPLICIPILYLSAIMPRMWNRPDYSPLMGSYYAHRGLHDNSSDAPENSIKKPSKPAMVSNWMFN